MISRGICAFIGLGLATGWVSSSRAQTTTATTITATTTTPTATTGPWTAGEDDTSRRPVGVTATTPSVGSGLGTTPVAPPPVQAPTVSDNSMNPLGLCATMLQSMFGRTNTANSLLMEQIADETNEKAGYQRYESWEDKQSKEIGLAANARYPAGCENRFINKNGELGPFGRTALAEFQRFPDQFVNNEPRDIISMCPGYKNWGKERREQFWVWTASSLAAPESSCNPGAANPNAPNGTAIGLFQVEKPFCDRFGVTGNLYDGHQNTRCMVRGLASELTKRNTVTTPQRVTYWGPLRADDWNTARGGDIRGGQKFRALVPQFPGCKN